MCTQDAEATSEIESESDAETTGCSRTLGGWHHLRQNACEQTGTKAEDVILGVWMCLSDTNANKKDGSMKIRFKLRKASAKKEVGGFQRETIRVKSCGLHCKRAERVWGCKLLQNPEH